MCAGVRNVVVTRSASTSSRNRVGVPALHEDDRAAEVERDVGVAGRTGVVERSGGEVDVVGPVAPHAGQHVLGHLHDLGRGLRVVHDALRAARGARRVEHRPRRRPRGTAPVRRAPRRSSRSDRRRRTRRPGPTARRPPPRPAGAAAPRSRGRAAPESSRIHAHLVGPQVPVEGHGGHAELRRRPPWPRRTGSPFGQHDRQPVTRLDARASAQRVGQPRRPFVELPVGQGAVAARRAHGGPGARPGSPGSPSPSRDPHRWNTNRRAPRHDARVRFCRSAQGQAAPRGDRRPRASPATTSTWCAATPAGPRRRPSSSGSGGGATRGSR